MPAALTTLREQFVTALQAGPRGLPPAHEISGASIRFQNADGSWGAYVNTQGPTGAAGAAQNFRDKAQLEAATVGPAIEFVTLSCYATPGIGAALYRKVGATQPADPRRIKSADNIWFRAYPDNVFDMTTLGAGQGSVTQDDTALNDVITYINSLGAASSSARMVIYYPNGSYNHTDCPTFLSRSDVAIIGQSRSGVLINYSGANPWIKVGDRTLPSNLARFLMRDLSVKFSSPTSTTALAALEATFDATFEELNLQSFNRVLTIGAVGVTASSSFSTAMRNCSGFSNNQGRPAIELNHGAGFYMSNVEWYVEGVSSPTHGSPQATATGTAVFQQINSQWDTVQVENCLFQFFDIFASLTGGIAINYYITNSILANCKRYVFLLDAGATGAIGSVRVANSWIESWEADAVLMSANGGFNDNHQFVGNYFSTAGLSNIKLINVLARNIIIANNRFGTANQIGSASAAIHVISGRGFTIANNTGNTDDTGSSAPYRAPFGILIGANAADYVITGNRMVGSSGSISITSDGLADKSRLCNGNSSVAASAGGYAGYVASGLTGGFYTNTTPFKQAVTIAGGTVLGIFIDGVTIAGATQGTFTLDPGSQLGVTSSAVPGVTVNNLA